MLENFLGFEDFRAGLRTYMREFAESNARGTDLWRHLQAASQQPVNQIMESWILQSGYPYITVNLETFNDHLQLHLRQERFFSKPQTSKDNEQVWQVPMVIRFADNEGVHLMRHVLHGAIETVTLQVAGDLRWCYINADEIGFYRQHLNAALLTKILANLEQLNPSEQMGLLADQWALTRSGHQNIAKFLDVLNALAAKSDNYNLLFDIVEYLRTLERMVEDIGNAAVIDRFRGWVTNLFKDLLEALGFEPRPGEATEISQQRISVIEAMARLARQPETVAQVRAWAEREAADPRSVDPNLAAMFVAVNAQFGDAAVFKQHVNIYQERKASGAPPQEVSRYLYSFPAFRAPELVTQTLSLLDEGIAPKEALGPLLGRMLNARHSQVAAWEYLKTNWSTIKELGLGGPELIKGAGQLSFSMRADLVEFCEAQVKGVADMAYAQAVETMDLLAEFHSRIKDDLIEWLNHVNR
jgi:puromycin-sensitive aminopeptidase